MKRVDVEPRAADDAALKRETGKDRAGWFAVLDQSGESGRSALGKILLAAKVDGWWIGTLLVDHARARGIVEKDGKPKGYSLCVTKAVAAPVARVFQAFTTARDLDRWFGPGTRITAEAGGKLENGDGNRATITKVGPDKALVMTWETRDLAPDSQIEVLFQPKADKTGIVVNHTRINDPADADATRAAWAKALTKLKALLEA